ncbi:MAG: metal-dependent hydrolase [Candidatus Kerfeldbacteria bacterium]|jgi:inner membrane protein
MKGKTHAIIGANVVWIPFLVGTVVDPWLVAVGALAALLPDLDASESKIKNLKVGGYIGGTKIWFKPFLPIAFVISSIFRHRGVMHSLLILILLSVGLMSAIPNTYSVITLVIMLGYVSHLVLDALTKSGIEFFWPIKKRLGLLPKALRVKTGGIVDTLLLLVGSVGVVLFLYNAF